jgi:hypothetical protein
MRSVERIQYIHFLVSEDILLPSSSLIRGDRDCDYWMASRASLSRIVSEGGNAFTAVAMERLRIVICPALLRRVAVDIWDTAR